MASFKRTFSSIWYGWNWSGLARVLFIFAVGLFFLFGAAYYGTRDRLPSTPRAMDLADARELVEGSKPCYVQLAAEPDFSKKIYRTGIWNPFWGNCPPDEIWDISADRVVAGDLRSLLGCAVNLSGRVDVADARTVRWPPQAIASEIKTVSIAPIYGTNELIWVKSDVAQGPAINLNDWQTSPSVTGVLATYDQALATLPSGFYEYARQVLPARPDAFMVCPDEPYTGESMTFFTTHFWVPVKGSDCLFLWTTADQEAGYGKTITGVLTPMSLTDHEARNRCYAHFETVTGTPLPERIGIIYYPTAQAYNDKLSGYSGMFMIFGVLWTVLGLSGILLYFIAPGLIYNAWQHLGLNPPGPKTRKRKLADIEPVPPKPAPKSRPAGANGQKPQPPVQKHSTGKSSKPERPVRPSKKSSAMVPAPGQPEAGPAARETNEHDFHPLVAPFSSLETVPEDPPPGPVLEAVFKDLRAVNPEENERYLAFVQDFSHPNNPDNGLCMIACDENMQAVDDALINAGQRHPGLAVHLLAINRSRFSCTNQIPPPTPAAYDLRSGDYVVMCHAPSSAQGHRVVITAVFGGSEYKAREQADTALAKEKYYSLMGRVFLIGDSENGPCQGLAKKSGSTLLRPLR